VGKKVEAFAMKSEAENVAVSTDISPSESHMLETT